MTWLLLRLLLWSWKNRILTRLRRLRQVRYLLSFAVGLAYVLFLWGPLRVRRWNVFGPGGAAAGFAEHLELGFSVLFTLLALLAWAWPRNRPALDFTEAEIAFLFPAPLHRRQVVNYSLLKGQFGIFFGALMLNLFGVRAVAPSFLQGLAGTWLALSTLQLYFLGTSITRANVLRHGRAGIRRALPVALGGAAIGGLLLAWGFFWLRPPTAAEMGNGEALLAYLHAMAGAGPMRLLLAPARWLVRPALEAGGLGALAADLLPALAMLALGYVWVIRSDFRYEEASAERAAHKATQRADRRSRRRRYERSAPASRRPPFALAPVGRPEVALVWKNLIAASRLFSPRMLLRVGAVAIAVAAVLSQTAGHGDWRPMVTALGGFCLAASGMLLLMGPLLIRSDMRADLLQASLLKQYPLPGWSLILGEVLAPTLVITALQLLLLVPAMVLLDLPFAAGPLDEPLLLVSFLILAGPLNFLSALLQNAMVLVFPSWLVLGHERARGLEAFGQRLLGSVVRVLALALIYLPAALIVGIGALVAGATFGMAAAPAVALLAAGICVAEAWVGVLAVGAVFDGFDPSRELDVAA